MDYQFFDADNHYYEPEDCFTRHGDEAVKRYVTWVSEGSKRHLLFGQVRTNDVRNPNSVMNPTFSRVAEPGAFHEVLKAIEAGTVMSMKQRYGELEPLRDAYRNRDARIMEMDLQGVERMVLFPTLGLTVEGYMGAEPEMLYKVMHAFNLWLDDDWGLNRDGRIYSAPVISMRTVEGAVAELEWAVSRGARVVTVQPGPAHGRSPADTYFDPFWARLNESGVLLAYHAAGGITSYDEAFNLQWGIDSNDRGYLNTFRRNIVPFEKPMMDTAQALILGNLFSRFPNLKVASIEMGSAWVPYMLHALDHSGPLLTRHVESFGQTLMDRPSDVFREKFWIKGGHTPAQTRAYTAATTAGVGKRPPSPPPPARSFAASAHARAFSRTRARGPHALPSARACAALPAQMLLARQRGLAYHSHTRTHNQTGGPWYNSYRHH
jgi:predicted TIM-barrel fold metal-dependent hydrolase